MQGGEFHPRPWYEKVFQGFCFAFGLILVILAPILLFSGINPIMVKNPVQEGQLSVLIEMADSGNQYEIIRSNAFGIRQLTDDDVNQLSHYFYPLNFQYDPLDMQKVHFNPYGDQKWDISPPALEQLKHEFSHTSDEHRFHVKAMWHFKRENPLGEEQAVGNNAVTIPKEKLEPIIDLISKSSKTEETVVVPYLFPKLLRLGSTSQSHFLTVQNATQMDDFTMAGLKLHRESENSTELYWTIEISKEDMKGPFEAEDTEALVMIVQNDEVIGSLFGSALQLSVVGLYATIVIAIGRFLRIIFDRISQRAIFEEMPNTDQLFEVCEGIFIAQLEGELKKEKRLYDLLIRMYRSPETLIKITGTKLKY